MLSRLLCATAVAVVALAGCANADSANMGPHRLPPSMQGYYYQQQGPYWNPNYGNNYPYYGDNGPYYGNNNNPYFGNNAPYFGNTDNGRYFRPERNVTCDKTRDVCFDQYGLSYTATKEYLGERSANGSVKRYGNQVLFFSPRKGVVCDRRAQTCSDSDGVDRKWTNRVF